MRSRGLSSLRVVLLVAFVLAAMLGLGLLEVSAQSLLDDIIDRGTLRVGMVIGLPPYAVFDSSTGAIQGSDVDVAQEIADALGVKLEIIDTSVPNRIPFLVTNKVDIVIACFTVTPERAISVGFSKPYLAIDIVMIGRKADTDIKSYKDLAGHSIAVPRGSTQDLFMTDNVPEGTKILRFDDSPVAYQAFKTGQADALVLASAVAEQWCEDDPSLEIKGLVYREYESIATRRDELEFINWLNILIDELGSKRRLANIYDKWFGGEAPRVMYDY